MTRVLVLLSGVHCVVRIMADGCRLCVQRLAMLMRHASALLPGTHAEELRGRETEESDTTSSQ